MMTSIKRNAAFLIVIVGFIQAYIISRGSLAGEKFVLVSHVVKHSFRAPTSLKRSLASLNFDNKLKISSSSARMMSEARIENKDTHSLLTLGHFCLLDQNDDYVFACQVFDRVQLKYEAVMVSEEDHQKVPELLLEGPCQISKSKITELEPFDLNFESLYSQPAGNGTFRFSYTQEGLIGRTANINGSWPRHWTLQSIKLIDTTRRTRALVIEGQTDTELHRRSLDFYWHAQTSTPAPEEGDSPSPI